MTMTTNGKFRLAATAALMLGAWPVLAVAEMPSTPDEQAQTRALNQSGQGGTYAAPQALNGQAGLQVPPAPLAAPATSASLGTPPGLGDALDPADYVTLATVDPDRLHAVRVETAAGETVGQVSNVELAANGTPGRVEIGLRDGREVWVAASALRFNARRNVLLTNLDAARLNAPPADRAAVE